MGSDGIEQRAVAKVIVKLTISKPACPGSTRSTATPEKPEKSVSTRH